MPGGVVEYPSLAVQSALARTIPQFPVDRFNLIASMYHTERDHVAEPPARVRERMAKIAKLASELWIELETMSEESADAIHEGALRVGISNPRQFSDALRGLMHLASDARLEVGELTGGAPRSAISALVARLSSEMRRLEMTVDARPRGDLVTLVTLVLEGYGHSTSGALKAVQRELDRTT